MNGQLLAAAPMEGLTTAVFRRLHHQYFGGTDLYYIPFITPTVEPSSETSSIYIRSIPFLF